MSCRTISRWVEYLHQFQKWRLAMIKSKLTSHNWKRPRAMVREAKPQTVWNRNQQQSQDRIRLDKKLEAMFRRKTEKREKCIQITQHNNLRTDFEQLVDKQPSHITSIPKLKTLQYMNKCEVLHFERVSARRENTVNSKTLHGLRTVSFYFAVFLYENTSFPKILFSNGSGKGIKTIP